MSAVGISQGFPAAYHDGELVEPQAVSMTEQQFGRSGELFGATRVGEHLGQQMRLGQTEHTTMRRAACFGNLMQQTCGLHHRLGFTRGPVTGRFRPTRRGGVTIFGISSGAFGDTDHLSDHRLKPSPGTIGLGQQRRQRPRPETLEIGNLRHIDRTHVPTVPKGCITVLLIDRTSAVDRSPWPR